MTQNHYIVPLFVSISRRSVHLDWAPWEALRSHPPPPLDLQSVVPSHCSKQVLVGPTNFLNTMPKCKPDPSA